MKKLLLAGLLALLPLAAAAQGTTYSPSLGGGTAFTGGAITSALAAPAADNCAAVPYSFTGDTNTGLCTSAADTFNLYTAGASRLSGNSTALTSTVPVRTTANGEGFTINFPTFPVVGIGRNATVGGLSLYANGVADASSALVGQFGHIVPSGSYYSWTSGAVTASLDTYLMRDAAASIQLGADVNGSAVAQTLKAHDGITGSDIAGANFTLAGGRGTGAGAPGNLIFQTSTALGPGATAQTLADRLTISPTEVTSTVPIVAPVGLVGTPSYTFTGLTNTGMYAAAGPYLQFAIGGVRAFYISGTTIALELPITGVGSGSGIGTTTTPFTVAYISGRGIQGSSSKTLVDNTATAFTRLAVADDDYEGCELVYTAYAEDADGDARQTRTGTVSVAVLNNSGTETAAFSTGDSAVAVTAGTFTCTFDSAGGTNTIDLRVTCDTSLDAAAETLTFESRLDCPSTVTVTPQ